MYPIHNQDFAGFGELSDVGDNSAVSDLVLNCVLTGVSSTLFLKDNFQMGKLVGMVAWSPLWVTEDICILIVLSIILKPHCIKY